MARFISRTNSATKKMIMNEFGLSIRQKSWLFI